MATHSSIPWTREPGGLWSRGLQRVGHDWSGLAHHRNRKGFDLSQTENCSLEDSYLDNSEVLLPRSIAFSPVFCLEKKKSNTAEIHSFKLSKEKKWNKGKERRRSARTQRINVALTLRKGIWPLKEDQHWCPRKGGHSIFVFNMDILFFPVNAPLKK